MLDYRLSVIPPGIRRSGKKHIISTKIILLRPRPVAIPCPWFGICIPTDFADLHARGSPAVGSAGCIMQQGSWINVPPTVCAFGAEAFIGCRINKLRPTPCICERGHESVVVRSTVSRLGSHGLQSGRAMALESVHYRIEHIPRAIDDQGGIELDVVWANQRLYRNPFGRSMWLLS